MPSDKKPEPVTLDLFAPRPAPPAATQQDTARLPPPPSPPPSRVAPAAPAASQQDEAAAAGAPAMVAAVVPAAVSTPAPPLAAPPLVEGPRTYRVSEVVRLANRALEARFADIWVEGEISNYRPNPSGHAYFKLKDA